MPSYTLVVETRQKRVKGKTALSGTVRIKNGKVLHEVMHASTLSDLSHKLRKSGLIPTNVTIGKKDILEFEYQSKKPL